MADKACGMPSGAAGELMTLDQQHIRLVIARQMIGGGAADNAAADHDDFGMGGKTYLGHGCPC